MDKLFSHVLIARVTAFLQQLHVALQGELNPSADYGDTNTVSSKQWLQLIGKKGVLLHFESAMVPMEVSTDVQMTWYKFAVNLEQFHEEFSFDDSVSMQTLSLYDI